MKKHTNFYQRYYDLKKQIGGNREKQEFEFTMRPAALTMHGITPPPAHIKRILSQVLFALDLNTRNENVFDEELEQAISNQKVLIKQMFQNGVAAKVQLDKYRETKDLGELTRELLVTMVSKVYVHEGKELDIVFRFSDEMEKLKSIHQMVQNDALKCEVV